MIDWRKALESDDEAVKTIATLYGAIAYALEKTLASSDARDQAALELITSFHWAKLAIDMHVQEQAIAMAVRDLEIEKMEHFDPSSGVVIDSDDPDAMDMWLATVSQEGDDAYQGLAIDYLGQLHGRASVPHYGLLRWSLWDDPDSLEARRIRSAYPKVRLHVCGPDEPGPPDEVVERFNEIQRNLAMTCERCEHRRFEHSLSYSGCSQCECAEFESGTDGPAA